MTLKSDQKSTFRSALFVCATFGILFSVAACGPLTVKQEDYAPWPVRKIEPASYTRESPEQIAEPPAVKPAFVKRKPVILTEAPEPVPPEKIAEQPEPAQPEKTSIHTQEEPQESQKPVSAPQHEHGHDDNHGDGEEAARNVEPDAGPAGGHGHAMNFPLPEAPVFRLGAGDQIRIIVQGEDDLSGRHGLASAGTVTMPLIGEVPLSGLTPAEAEDAIEAALLDGYLNAPEVSVNVVKYRPFFVMGEVETPGSYGYESDIRVINAVAFSGGFSPRADHSHVEITRTGKDGKRTTFDADTQAEVLPGDVIIVKERSF